jgi:uncharacterized membrane-anchored protein
MRFKARPIAPRKEPMPIPRIRTRAKSLEPVAAKVPEITLMFWVLKLISTGMGEAMSDSLGDASVALAGVVGIFGFWIAIKLQMNQREYKAPYYWFAVMMVAVFGTMAADGLHDGTSLSYPITSAIYALITAGVFVAWYRSEGTLSIHTINTRRRERFYWAAVLGTFALGTAAGDMTATAFNLGYGNSIILFAAIIAIPAIGWWRFQLNPIVGFWFAYIVTRPLGASFADWFGKPPSISGLGLGDPIVSGLAFVVFAALVAYVTVTKRDVQRSAVAEAHAGLHAHAFEPALDESA